MPGGGCFSVFMTAVLATSWLMGAIPAHAATQGEWVFTGSPTVSGRLATLSDGTPLLLGGNVLQYRPDTGTWSPRGSLGSSQKNQQTITVLPSDLVLLAGGFDQAGHATREAHVYNPVTGTSVMTGAMQFARADHRATLLASGKVLVSGGRNENGQVIAPAELYDPRTGQWSLTGISFQARADHTAVRLRNDKVLVAGGSGVGGALASAELYDPDTGTWAPASAIDRPRSTILGAVLADGRVLVVGQDNASQTADSQIYDPVAGTWAPAVPVPFAGDQELVILQDGTPLLTSTRYVPGFLCGGFNTSAALFDVHAPSWNATAPVAAAGLGPMVVLRDGRVLGVAASCSALRAQLFRPDNTTPRLTVVPNPVDFGKTSPNTTVQKPFELRNTGEAQLVGSVGTVTVGSGTAPGTFSVASGGDTFSLAPGASKTVVVRFAPGSAFGTFSGTLPIASNGNWLAVPLGGGTGVQLAGRIADASGDGVAGVTVNLTGAASGSTVTDATGQYRLFAPPNNGYNVSPAGGGLTFTPSTRGVVIGTQDLGGLDFSAAFTDGPAAFVSGLYENVLGRVADSAGFTSWHGFLRQRCNASGFRVVVDGFFDSPEFRTARPLTLASLTTALYRAILYRDPDPGGLAAYVDAFRQDRRELAIIFVDSLEFAALLPDRGNRSAVTTIVTRFYTELLGRSPDGVGLTGWVDYIVATGDVGGPAAAFVSSPEFEARALTSRDYVTLLYRSILGRNPDQAGLDGWDGLLRSQMLGIIDGSLITSDEFREQIPQICGG